jgi:hypothetical protein
MTALFAVVAAQSVALPTVKGPTAMRRRPEDQNAPPKELIVRTVREIVAGIRAGTAGGSRSRQNPDWS